MRHHGNALPVCPPLLRSRQGLGIVVVWWTARQMKYALNHHQDLELSANATCSRLLAACMTPCVAQARLPFPGAQNYDYSLAATQACQKRYVSCPSSVGTASLAMRYGAAPTPSRPSAAHPSVESPSLSAERGK